MIHMEQLPQDWLALLFVVFTLGVKHGLDADHLAAIDGLTRFNVQQKPRLAPWCGSLFSLGHGAVVVAIALAVSALARHWAVPEWMEDIGAWTSIVVLAVLGVMNLLMVLRAQPGEMVRPVALKGRLFGRLQRTSNPWLIGLVGALFAFSFDTMSQASLFALTGTQNGGSGYALMLGALFTTGMMVTDGINGLLVARLIRHADHIACVASRVMGLAVGGLSLAVSGFGICKYVSPEVGAWSQGKELSFGLSFIAVVGLSFLLAVRAARAVNA